MEWDRMTEEEKRACYDSYMSELKVEWGDSATPVPLKHLTLNGRGKSTNAFNFEKADLYTLMGSDTHLSLPF